MMAQLLAHLWGDYLLQSDWMAQFKRSENWPALVHAFVYSVCFIPLIWGHPRAIWVFDTILWTHFWIDRLGLARYLVWAKNYMGPRRYWILFETNGSQWKGFARNQPWRFCKGTGYPSGREPWLAVWLTIIADNTLHLTINYLALRYL